MNRSVVILITALWLFCISYGLLGTMNGYPYASAAIVMSWVFTVLMIILVIRYIIKHSKNKSA
jgi:hypothetical protein